MKIMRNFALFLSLYLILFGGIEIAKWMFSMKFTNRFPEDVIFLWALLATPLIIFIVQFFFKAKSFRGRYLICSIIVFLIMVSQFFIFNSFYQKDNELIAFKKLKNGEMQLSLSENELLTYYLERDLSLERRLLIYKYFLAIDLNKETWLDIFFTLRDMAEHKNDPKIKKEIETLLFDKFIFSFNIKEKSIDTILSILLADNIYTLDGLPGDNELLPLGKWYILSKKENGLFYVDLRENRDKDKSD